MNPKRVRGEWTGDKDDDRGDESLISTLQPKNHTVDKDSVLQRNPGKKVASKTSKAMKLLWQLVLIFGLLIPNPTVFGANIMEQYKGSGKFLEYYDCTKPRDVFRMQEPEECQGKREETVTKFRHSTAILLAPKIQWKVEGFRCTSAISEFKGYCGAYSHFKWSEVPKIKRNVKVTGRQCLEARIKGSLLTPDNKRIAVRMGETTIHPYFATGDIKHYGENLACDGLRVQSSSGIINSALNLASYEFTVTRETFIWGKPKKMQAVVAGVSLPSICKPQDGVCETQGGAFIWKQGEDVCPWEYRSTQEGCNRLELYPTSMGGIALTTDIHAMRLEKMNAADTPIAENTYGSLEYLSYVMNDKMNKLQKSSIADKCLKLRDLKDGEESLWEGEDDGIFIRKEFHLYYRYKCERVQGEAVVMKGCFSEVPVLSNGAIKYVEARTMTASTHGRYKTCNELFPTVFRATDGNFYSLSPSLAQVEEPAMPTTVSGRETALQVSQLFSPTQLRSWENFLEIPKLKESIVQRYTLGTCKQEGTCGYQESEDHILPLNMATLGVPNIEEELRNQAGGMINLREKIHQAYENLGKVMITMLTLEYTMVAVTAGYSLCIYGVLTTGRLLFQRFGLNLRGIAFKRKFGATVPERIELGI